MVDTGQQSSVPLECTYCQCAHGEGLG
jgi:hypothetical protein